MLIFFFPITMRCIWTRLSHSHRMNTFRPLYQIAKTYFMAWLLFYHWMNWMADALQCGGIDCYPTMNTIILIWSLMKPTMILRKWFLISFFLYFHSKIFPWLLLRSSYMVTTFTRNEIFKIGHFLCEYFHCYQSHIIILLFGGKILSPRQIYVFSGFLTLSAKLILNMIRFKAFRWKAWDLVV